MPVLLTEGSYIDERVLHSIGSTDECIDFERVGDDHELEVSHVSVENRTTAYTRLVIGIRRGPDFFEREEEDAPAANDIYWTRSVFIVPEGFNLRLKLTGCTSGDEVHAFIQGCVKKVR